MSLKALIAILVGSGITASTTYAVVRHVQQLTATATVDDDPKIWMTKARTEAYDPCYLGCNDCGDPGFAAKACARTAQAVNVTGMPTCNGRRLWNWKERYPPPCLRAVGDLYKADALEAVKDSYQNQLMLIFLTVLAGLFGAILTYNLCNTTCCRRNNNPTTTGDRDHGPGDLTPKRRHNSFRKFISGFLFTPFCPSLAFPCTRSDQAVNKYFTNANHTIFGSVHSWISGCETYDFCTQSCKQSCSGNGSCTTSCTPDCTAYQWYDEGPDVYVAAILPNITACGFTFVDDVEVDVDMRVASPGIEAKWLVKISVNAYNVTDATATDPQVWCLYDLGGD